MKEYRFKIFIVLAFIALSAYLLYPTFVDIQNTKKIDKYLNSLEAKLKSNSNITSKEISKKLNLAEDSILVTDPSIKENRDKRVKLGLDLQGGMYLVMEVNTSKLLEKLAKNPDEDFQKFMQLAIKDSKSSQENLVTLLSRRIQSSGKSLSRYFGSIRDEDADIISRLETQEKDAVTRAIEIISNRVNQYGVSEPNIQQVGSRRIIVELPGVSKEEEAKKLLQGSALLEFKLVKEADFTIPIMQKIDNILAGTQADSTKDTTNANKELSKEEFAANHPFFAIAMINQQSQYADAFVRESDIDKLNSYLNRPEVKNAMPDNVEFLYSAKPEAVQDGENIYRLYLVNKNSELTGGVITDAQANIDPSTTQAIVNMQMNSEGAREWARITGANIKKRCAVVLDGAIYSAPVIQNKIPNGNSQITGMADMNEAKLLEIVLKAGALPAPLEIIEERTVGPSLGQDSISAGVNSFFWGFLLVAIFMIVYYKVAGVIADMALMFTVLFILGILAGFHATLTLPGIAGIILTVGMAVDANIIIYERIREELATGKTVKAAIEGGFSNSFSAIFDSNITTFFSGIILYQFGSGPIQGFALTLMIGIISTLFSALVITRLVFDLLAAKGNKINIG